MRIGTVAKTFRSISEESLARVDDALTILTLEVLTLLHLRAYRQRAFVLVCFGGPQDARDAVEVAWNALNHAQSLYRLEFPTPEELVKKLTFWEVFMLSCVSILIILILVWRELKRQAAHLYSISTKEWA
jgi:uncharacterized membrane protein YwaF